MFSFFLRFRAAKSSYYVLVFHKTLLPVNGKSYFPAHICWSWRRLQHVFSVTYLRLPRRLQGVLGRRKIVTRKTSWRRLGKRKIVTRKTSWRHLEDMSWRRLEDMSWRCLEDLLKILWRQTKYLLGISVYLSRDLTNLNVYLTSLYFTISDNSKANPKCINYWWLVWCYEISLIQIRHCRKGEAIKTNF